MTTVFIAGSIAIKRLHDKVRQRIAKAVTGGLSVVVGDADGADTAITQMINIVRIFLSNIQSYNFFNHLQ